MAVVRGKRAGKTFPVERLQKYLDRLDQLPPARWLSAMRGLGDDERVALWDFMGEARRQSVIAARAAVPEECGPEMRSGPAQGRLVPFMPRGVMVDAKGDEQRVDLVYRGRSAARIEDVFDRMLARQPKADREAHGPAFDPGQVAIARHYRNLAESIAGSDMRGVDLNGLGGGGSGDRGVSAVMVDRLAEMRALQRRIGGGYALSLRRVRPSERGARRAVSHLDLVEQVCVGQMTVTAVLGRANWAVRGEAVKRLRVELCGCLDRMNGYMPRQRAGTHVWTGVDG
jgi:hypothetical protein